MPLGNPRRSAALEKELKAQEAEGWRLASQSQLKRDLARFHREHGERPTFERPAAPRKRGRPKKAECASKSTAGRGRPTKLLAKATAAPSTKAAKPTSEAAVRLLTTFMAAHRGESLPTQEALVEYGGLERIPPGVCREFYRDRGVQTWARPPASGQLKAPARA